MTEEEFLAALGAECPVGPYPEKYRWITREEHKVDGNECAECKNDNSGRPSPQIIDGVPYDARYWGVTKSQVQHLRDKLPENLQNASARKYVKEYVKEKTKGTGLGLAMTLNRKKPRKVNLMVSHSWDENIKKFYEDLVKHMRDDEVAFVCFLGLYQNEDGAGPYLTEQLGAKTIEDSPFFQVITSFADVYTATNERTLSADASNVEKIVGFYKRIPCYVVSNWARNVGIIASLPTAMTQGNAAYYASRDSWTNSGRMLVIPNEELMKSGKGLYSRLWCAFELCIAVRMQVPVYFITNRLTPEYFFKDVESSVEQARCGDPALEENDDEKRIRKCIEQYGTKVHRALGLAESYKEMDDVLRNISESVTSGESVDGMGIRATTFKECFTYKMKKGFVTLATPIGHQFGPFSERTSE